MKTKDKNAKLTFENWHGTFTIELTNWDYNFEQYIEMCKGIAFATGFKSKTVESFFDDESK